MTGETQTPIQSNHKRTYALEKSRQLNFLAERRQRYPINLTCYRLFRWVQEHAVSRAKASGNHQENLADFVWPIRKKDPPKRSPEGELLVSTGDDSFVQVLKPMAKILDVL